MVTAGEGVEKSMRGNDEIEDVDLHWVRAYRIDNERGVIDDVGHAGELDEYVRFYVKSLRDSRRTAPYEPKSPDTEVMSLICRSASNTFSDTPAEEFESCRVAMNNRFLRKETEAQEKIARLRTIIKSGCLIHAMVSVGSASYYLLAKLDWNDYLESVSMHRSSGIAFDSKVLGKSCLAKVERVPGGSRVAGIEVSLDSADVKYFVSDFLEVESIYDDATSTEKMTKSVVDLIDRNFKKKEPRVRLELKNGFLCAVRSTELVDYGTIIDDVFRRYLASSSCPVSADKSQRFLDALEGLPDKKGFSRQFTVVAKSIKPRIVETKYKLGQDVELVLKGGGEPSSFRDIESGTDPNGKTYLKIYTDEQEAIKAFNVGDAGSRSLSGGA